MINNTAEGFISVVFPYKLEVNITDVTDKESVFADLGSNMMSFKTLLG